MRIRLTNLSGSAQVSTQLGVLAPNQSIIVEVDAYEKYAAELATLVSIGSISVATLSSAPTTIEENLITRPLNLYVSTSGLDTNPGSIDKPFRSIQAAINTLNNKLIQSLVTISVGPGSFKAFSIDGNMIRFPTISNHITPYTAAAGLTIIGTWSTPTLTGGTVSGTATGAVVNLAVEVTDTGQAWTTNELRGKYLFIGGLYHPIISNTATIITIPTNTVQSGAYSIWDIGTQIDTETAAIGTLAGTQVGRVAIQNIETGAGSILTLSTMYLNMDGLASGVCAIATRLASAAIENVSMVRSAVSVTLTGLSVSAAKQISMTRCYISFPSTLGNAITSSTRHDFLRILNTYIRNGAVGISAAAGSSFTSLFNNTFDSIALAVNAPSNTVIGLLAGNRFTSCTNAITIGSASTAGFSQLTASSTVYFTGCTTILTASSGSLCALATASGTGNTNGIVLTKGARCQIGNTATLGASTELSVDGTTGTLVALRAASPRVFPAAANPYATYVYE